MKKPCRTNNDYASLIVSDLIHLGISTFCIGSGSRCAPIAKALKNNPAATTLLHYDERSLGFYSLGVAKATCKPVCLVTTSGSAVANLMPAVMEAYMDNIPLILITCDRGFEDLDRGMNQTCKQDQIFGEYVSYSKSFPSLPHNFDIATITSSISYLVAVSKKTHSPVHLNLPFSIPLISDDKLPSYSHPITKYLPTNSILSDESLMYIMDILSSHEKGVIIVGGNYEQETAGAIITLAEKIGYPILADPLSNVRELGSSSVTADYYNQVIHHTKKLSVLKPDVVLFLGGHIISKNILFWAKSLQNSHQIVVSNKNRHIDPTLQITTAVSSEIRTFVTSVNENIKRKEPSLYLSLWKQYSLAVENSIEEFFEDKDKLYEPSVVNSLVPLLRKTPFSIFLGNSLTIRYGDNFLFPKKVTQKIYGNRGVSGIDGNISTALGICTANNTPLLAIMGDATFLHDVGALSLMSTEKTPLIIVVINNNGGGIFDFLPYSNQKELLDTHISPPTDLNIGNIASSFNIPFWKAETTSDYLKMIDHLLLEQTGGIIEVPSNREENIRLHQRLDEHIELGIEKSIKKGRSTFFTLPRKKTSFASTDF